MILVGITGPIGHGKSTLADALAALEPSTQHFESFEIVAAVAEALYRNLGTTIPKSHDIPAINNWLEPLPQILEETVHTKTTFKQIKIDPEHAQDHPVEYEKLFMHLDTLAKHPELATEHITQENKAQHRPILQWLGGYLVKKVDPSIWYDEMIRRAIAASKDGAKLCVVGGVRFPVDANVIRDADGLVVKIYRPGMKQPDIQDPTERERDNIQVDTTIMNNGSVVELQAVAEQFLRDARAGQLKPSYHATAE